MDEQTIARELAEEIRTNARLRHRLGMEEGSETQPVLQEDFKGVAVTTVDGDQFVIAVGRV